MKFNKMLILLRKAHGLTQKDFCMGSGLSVKNVSSWERGLTEPYYKDLKKIAEYYNITLSYLVSGTPIDKKDFEVDKKIDAYNEEIFDKIDFAKLINDAKYILDYYDLPRDKYLPVITNQGFDIKYFKFENNLIQFDKDALMNANDIEAIKKVFYKTITVKDAIKLDNTEILEIALERYDILVENAEIDMINADNSEEYDELSVKKDNLVKEWNINYYLENLPKDLKNYFKFIVILIDHGAFYEKEVGSGDKITSFKKIKDVSKTNFIYNIAKTKFN